MSSSPRPVRGWIKDFLENHADSIDAIFGSVEASQIRSTAYFETVSEENVSGTVTLDLSDANLFKRTLTGNTTFEFTAAGDGSYQGNSLTLIVQQDGAGGHSITWPNSVEWDSGAVPNLSTNANDKHLLTFVSDDNGSTWLGIVGPTNIS